MQGKNVGRSKQRNGLLRRSVSPSSLCLGFSSSRLRKNHVLAKIVKHIVAHVQIWRIGLLMSLSKGKHSSLSACGAAPILAHLVVVEFITKFGHEPSCTTLEITGHCSRLKPKPMQLWLLRQ